MTISEVGVCPCVAKTCAVQPRWQGSWGQQIEEFARRGYEANASPVCQGEACGRKKDARSYLFRTRKEERVTERTDPVQSWSLEVLQNDSSRPQPQHSIKYLDPRVHNFYPQYCAGV